MWNAAHQFERAAERAATERAKRAVLHAIGYNDECFQRGERPPLVPRFGEQLHDLFVYDIVPFLLYSIKACFLLFALLLGSIGTYGIIWGWFIMRGQEVMHRPIFFDYTSSPVGGGGGETMNMMMMMPAGVVDLRSTKSAPWVHYSCGQEDDVCRNNNGAPRKIDNLVSSTRKVNAILASGERYFFEVTLTLPESEINKQLGVFMVKVDLRSDDRSLLASSKQHSMLPYESKLVTLFRKMMLILPLSSGFLDETRTITLLCFDNYVDVNDEKPMSLVEVSLRVPNPAAFPATLQTIQIHSAELRYGKELREIQKFFRHWHYSCAFFGIAVIFIGYVLIALTILNNRARKNRLIAQPYADFFDSDDDDDDGDGDSALNSNSASQDVWMGADIEIPEEEEEEEEDSHAWEPINTTGKNGHSKGPAKVTNNCVSDDESLSSNRNVPGVPQNNNVQGRGNANLAFPLGTLANNSTVKSHEPLFATKPKDEGTKRKNGSSDEEGEDNTDPKTPNTQEKEEERLADMVMKGQSKWDFISGGA